MYNYLKKKNPEFADWIIISAYYTANHFARSKIFPLKDKISGKSISHPNLSSYCTTYRRRGESKHQTLSRLFRKKMGTEVGASYRFLLDRINEYRYQNYKVPNAKQVLKKVEQHLDVIERACN